MKDAFGGIMNIFFIAVFLLIVSGVLAFTVNYIKAFHMKNEIISDIERYEAGQQCFDDQGNCAKKIVAYAESIGYSPYSDAEECKKENMDVGVQNIFCYKCYNNNTNHGEKWYNGNTTKYCSISTKVDISIPIINKIMEYRIFKVHGDTRIIQVPVTK